MTVSVLGNNAPGYKGAGATGIGAANLPAGLGWTSLSSNQAGDTHVVFSIGIKCDISLGYYFQSTAGATVEFSLGGTGMLQESPDDGPWTDPLALPANDIVRAELICVAMRITFTAPGQVYIGAR